MYPSVFVACPTHIVKRYCAAQFVGAVLEHAPGAAFTIVANSRGNPAPYYRREGVRFIHQKLGDEFYDRTDSIHKRIVHSVNFLRQLFLNGEWEYYLSLEADVILNAATLPAMLDRLMSFGAVLTTNCYPGFHTVTEFSRVDRLTMGCTLIKRPVLELVEFRYDQSLLAAHYDAFFAHDCNVRKIPMWYDPAIVLEHKSDSQGYRGWHQLPPIEVT